MKYNGKRPGPNVEFLVLPRPDGDIELKFQAILDFDEFNKMCPEPEMPIRRYPDGRTEPDANNPDYKIAVSVLNKKRLNYMVLKALEVNPELEWERVKLDDPKTWEFWTAELKEANFSPAEINQIVIKTMAANTVDEEKVEAAKKRFLASQGRSTPQVPFPGTEQPTT